MCTQFKRIVANSRCFRRRNASLIILYRCLNNIYNECRQGEGALPNDDNNRLERRTKNCHLFFFPTFYPSHSSNINPPISADATGHTSTHATRTPVGPLLHFLINTRTGFLVFFYARRITEWYYLSPHRGGRFYYRIAIYLQLGRVLPPPWRCVRFLGKIAHDHNVYKKITTTRNSIHIPTGTDGISEIKKNRSDTYPGVYFIRARALYLNDTKLHYIYMHRYMCIYSNNSFFVGCECPGRTFSNTLVQKGKIRV